LIEIEAVLPGSVAARRGIGPGDRLVSINGHDVRDSIDCQYLAAEERLSLIIEKRNGTRNRIRIVKGPDDTLGLVFPPLAIRRCRNKCIFCFVDQMPPACRKSLYIKDDDYRASFLFGNYITLGNLREDDWDRIFTQRLSPLYISVHATEHDLRRRILNNRQAPDIMAGLRRLAGGGIRMHTQIVLCPGINDGHHLERTVDDLASLFPAVQSIAAVPVGLTAHRGGLVHLRTYRRNEAREIIALLNARGVRFRRRLGTRLVFASDEFFIKAALPFPPLSYYEDFPQIENGVGMVADFLRDAGRTRLPARMSPVRATVITGVSFAPVLAAALRRLSALRGVSLRVLPVKSDFFGPTVTVSGLLAGQDILRAIRGKRLGDVLMLPANALKEDTGLFIDDLTLSDVEKAAGVPVRPVLRFSDALDVLAGLNREIRT
jgi:putative radical SAM enzyme (TIGR03279 family)